MTRPPANHSGSWPGCCRIFVGALFLVSALSATAEGEVAALQAKFDEARQRTLSPIEEQQSALEAQYLRSLAELESRFQRQGQLEETLQVVREREAFESGRTIGSDGPQELQKLRKNYLQRLDPLQQAKLEKEAQLTEILRRELKKLQVLLTRNGDLNEAMKAKTVADGLKSVQPEGPVSTSSAPAPSKAPWQAPAPKGADILKGGTFLEPVSLPVGKHRLRDKITIGKRAPVKSAQVYLLEGTELSCAGDGEIFVAAGKGHAFGAIFRTASLSGGLAGDWHFINCILDRTQLRKGDGWRGRQQASRWKFENCHISGDLFRNWNTTDIGYHAVRCTFDKIKFPDLSYREDAGAIAQKSTLLMEDCRFVGCDIPLSVLITTRNCTFENCSFREDDGPIDIKTPIQVTVFSENGTNRLRELPSHVTVKFEPKESATGQTGRVSPAN